MSTTVPALPRCSTCHGSTHCLTLSLRYAFAVQRKRPLFDKLLSRIVLEVGPDGSTLLRLTAARCGIRWHGCTLATPVMPGVPLVNRYCSTCTANVVLRATVVWRPLHHYSFFPFPPSIHGCDATPPACTLALHTAATAHQPQLP